MVLLDCEKLFNNEYQEAYVGVRVDKDGCQNLILYVLYKYQGMRCHLYSQFQPFLGMAELCP